MQTSSPLFYRSRLWLFIWVYIFSIYLSLPFMRSILQYLKSSMGPEKLLLALNVLLVCSALAVLAYAASKGLKVAAMVALSLGCIGVITINLSITEERVHFLQYGLLGIVVMATRERGSTVMLIKLTAFAVAIGVIDEAIQWALPNRVGDPRDVAFNATATILGVWIGKALFWRPSAPSS